MTKNTRLALAVAGPVTLLAAVFLVPHAADTDVKTTAEAEAQLAVVAAHQPATYLGFLCIAVALALIGSFGWQLGRLPTGRGRITARIGGGMVLVGGVAAGLANLVLGVLQTTAAQPGLDRAAAAHQLVTAEAGWVLSPFFIPYLVGLVGGSVILTIGLLLGRVQPWWLTTLVGVSIFAIFFASTGPTGLIVTLVMAAAFVLTARRPVAAAPYPQPVPSPAPVNLAG
jgi:hypothetical protein